jgi:hypothetical protein
MSHSSSDLKSKAAEKKQIPTCYLLQGAFLLDLLFNPKDGGDSSETSVDFRQTTTQ